MTLEELQNQADKDLKINDVELDIESLKTPQLHNKYSKFHTKYKNLLKVDKFKQKHNYPKWLLLTPSPTMRETFLETRSRSHSL